MSSRPLQLRRRSKPSLGARARTYWIPAILVIAVAAGLGWALAAAPMFRLSRIDVVGNGRVAGSDVIARANLNPNENVWLADVRGAERRIEAIPYVLSAHVHRRFPAAVRISIVERVPEALRAVLPAAIYPVEVAGELDALAADVDRRIKEKLAPTS